MISKYVLALSAVVALLGSAGTTPEVQTAQTQIIEEAGRTSWSGSNQMAGENVWSGENRKS